uniref:Integrase catalytic domain-containing protein n=1 Tax=Tanacetum cinerariifolium TaxID=118510 RepID=A0A6L2KLE5_TANCI|nr:hypothetical protein [Tanacetum cinerariifolium]
MTRNISYLFEYEPYDGGYVSVRHEGEKITGKGIIKTGKLKFENVYFVKELKYNLFSVSQICDNKNSVLFTDFECLGLRKDFKLNDDTNMFLRTPRQHNMYSIDLNNIIPHKNLTCLVAKAFVNETVTDDFSRFTWTFFLRTKDDTSSILRNFIPEIENLKVLKVKIIRCDNEGEFKNQEMNKFCTKKGIRRGFSNARTPQQNRVAERRNRTLIEAVRTMLADAKLHVTFWAEAVNTACYVQNRVLVNKTKKVEENLHVDFLENKFIEKRAGPNWLFDIDTLTNSMNYVPVVFAGTSSTNISAHMETSNDTIRNSDAQDDSQKEQDCNADVSKSSGISNPTATLKVPSADQVEPANHFKRGFSQKETPSLGNALALSNRFEDTFGDTTNAVTLNEVEADLSNMESSITVSPTPTFRIHKDHPKSQIIGPVDTPIQTRLKSKDMEEQSFIVDQMDVKSAFLYGTIDEEVYVMQPPRFQDPEFLERVYKVEKAMHGHHQAPRAWYGTLYKEFEALMHDKFQMNAMGELNFFLGLQVLQKKDGIFLSQDKYVGDILKKFRYLDVRIETTDQETKIIATVDGKPRTISESSLRRHLKLNDEEGISSLPNAELFENLSLMGYNILPNQSNIATDVVCLATKKGKGLANPTEPHHTPSPQEHHSPQHDSPLHSHQTFISEPIPHDLQAPIETLTPRRLTRRDIRIAQSKALSPNADELASLLGDDRHEEAFPTISSLDAGQDRENIAKTSAMPHESSPRVPSLDANKGNIGEELRADKSTEKGSNDTEEMVNVLSSMEAANILSSGGAAASVSPVDVFPSAGVPTVSGSFPTPMRIPIISAKDKGKEKVTETEVPKKKKLQEQIDAQVAREMEEEFARENQRLSEQVARDYEIAKIHAKKELKLMIEGLDRSNEVITKHLSEYEQAKADLSVGEKIELINFEDLLWTYHQALMHDALDWKLYDTCGVYHMSTKNQEIFMLVEKDYPLRKELATVMIIQDEELFEASSPGIPTACYGDPPTSTFPTPSSYEFHC